MYLSKSGLVGIALGTVLSAVAAETPAPVIEVALESIKITKTANFDHKGVFEDEETEIEVEVQVTPPAGTKFINCRGVQVDECVSDKGDSLIKKDSGDEHRANGMTTFADYQRDRNSYSVTFDLDGKKRSINSITSLRGSLMLRVPTGALKQARIAPIKDWLGKSIEIEALGEELVIQRTPGKLKLSGNRSFFDSIQKITFTDADGHDFTTSNWSGNTRNSVYERSYNVTIPDDGAVSFQLYGKVSDVTVPFSFKNLALSAAVQAIEAGKSEPKLKLKLDDVPEPKAPTTEGAKKAEAEGVKKKELKDVNF